MILHLISKYPKRFAIFEHTHVGKVVLHNEKVLLDTGSNTARALKVVMCTNGFENIKIFHESGLEIDTRFHHNVQGVVNFMSGYLNALRKPPTAISYFITENSEFTDPYFYLTRRMYDYEGEKDLNLISIGGPELILDKDVLYTSDIDYPEDAQSEIDEFVRTVYEGDINKKIDYAFKWHGVMGYTPNGVRLIGTEPKSQNLLYNLGCNGVGILPSIFGGRRISQIIAGEKISPSIFDPRE
jgi:glycine/D-amino acid oxidase-like deaminating enzyme